MESNKKGQKYWHEVMTPLFAAISYFIADYYQISDILFNFSDNKWHVTISVGIYTAILNMFYICISSKRTDIKVEIVDRKDKSNKVRVMDEPRSIEVITTVEGNLENIKQNITLKFPKWIDVSTQDNPDLKIVNNDLSTTYEIILENTTKKDKKVFKFDIYINPIYMQSGRSGVIESEFKGSSWRYNKDITNLEIHYLNEEE